MSTKIFCDELNNPYYSGYRCKVINAQNDDVMEQTLKYLFQNYRTVNRISGRHSDGDPNLIQWMMSDQQEMQRRLRKVSYPNPDQSLLNCKEFCSVEEEEEQQDFDGSFTSSIQLQNTSMFDIDAGQEELLISELDDKIKCTSSTYHLIHHGNCIQFESDDKSSTKTGSLPLINTTSVSMCTTNGFSGQRRLLSVSFDPISVAHNVANKQI